MRYTTPRKKPTRRRNPGETLVVASKIKEYVKSKGMRASGDLIDALSEKIRYEIDKAAQRAKDNGRQTIRGSDV